MDNEIDGIVSRSVLKRPLDGTNAGTDTLLKKPALANPLQEVNNSVPNQNPSVTAKIEEEAPKEKPHVTMQQIIDEHDRGNQIYFSKYAQRIVNNWLKVEEKFHCSPNYLDGQNDIKSYMRETLIDWIIEVNNRFRHRRETLYLCVNIIDRYVATSIREKTDVISRSNYQLVGVTAYFIACKYEEIYYPEIHNLLTFADNIYTEENVKQMEIKIINTLKYDLTIPTTNKFLNRFLRISGNRNLHFMCYFICDRMLQSISMLQWKPSIQAGAALYLGRKYLQYETCWTKDIEEFTGLKKSAILQCAITIHELINKPSKLQACAHKYKSSRYNQIYLSLPQRQAYDCLL